MTSEDKTLEETGVKEGDFLVVTVTIAKKNPPKVVTEPPVNMAEEKPV
jgi:alanine dehydrogenase